MAKKEEPQKTEIVEVEQADSFGPIDERMKLIDEVYEKNEKELAESENQEQVEEEGGLLDQVEETETVEEKPDEYQRLKDERDNYKGQATEEREKRKAKSQRYEESQSQLREVLQDYKKLKEAYDELSSKQSEAFEYVGEEEPQNAVMTELKKLRDEIGSLKSERANERQKSAEERHYQNLMDTDKELAKEGYPGFYIGRAAVTDHLIKMVKEDPDNSYLDSPEGWKKIYKETVFPGISNHFDALTKKKTKENKVEAKKKANVVTMPGQSPESPKKDDDEWTYEDYLNQRRSNQLS